MPQNGRLNIAKLSGDRFPCNRIPQFQWPLSLKAPSMVIFSTLPGLRGHELVSFFFVQITSSSPRDTVRSGSGHGHIPPAAYKAISTQSKGWLRQTAREKQNGS
jgi:hypothetical protein